MTKMSNIPTERTPKYFAEGKVDVFRTSDFNFIMGWIAVAPSKGQLISE